MTRKNGNRSLAEIKALLEESDFLRPMVRGDPGVSGSGDGGDGRGGKGRANRKGDLATAAAITPRSLVTRVGKLELRVPQDRNGCYQRSEGPGGGAHPDVYSRGLDPQSPKRSVVSLCEHSFSASAISEINKLGDGTKRKRRLARETPRVVSHGPSRIPAAALDVQPLTEG